MKNNLLCIVFTFFLISSSSYAMKNIYDINVVNIDGEHLSINNYKGKLLMIVNTASNCGFTSQYAELQKLHEIYSEKGLVIMGFPSNNFMGQEPGSDEEIKLFCKSSYDVNFPMFSKIDVKGSNQHKLYNFLTSKKTNPNFSGSISWNFNKFLISRTGEVIGRFGSMTSPQSKKVILLIEENL